MKAHVAARLFPLLPEDELQALAEDIKVNGLQHEIVIYEGAILDGRNRFEACRRVKVEPRFIEWKKRGSPTTYVISANLRRRHLTQSQAASIAAESLSFFENEARERQREGGKTRHQVRALMPEAETPRGRAREHAATAFNVSPRYVEQAKTLKDTAPELFQAVKAGEKTLTEATREAKREQIKERIATKPTEKYRILYADPPWKYGDSRDGLEGTTGATAHYPTMTISELCALPVSEWTEEDAVLFLWVTSPLLFECLPVIKAWGFQYKTSFVWDKIKHNIGHYNSVRHEFLLICTRGSCVPETPKLFDSVQSIERKEHSQKPAGFREIIETLYPHGKRLELFARESVNGWDVYGNEV